MELPYNFHIYACSEHAQCQPAGYNHASLRDQECGGALNSQCQAACLSANLGGQASGAEPHSTFPFGRFDLYIFVGLLGGSRFTYSVPKFSGRVATL
jgi:hypothetical protein